MLVLSAAVLVIVIDARDVGPWGWRAGFNTKDTELTKVFLGVGARGVGHGVTRMITERD